MLQVIDTRRAEAFIRSLRPKDTDPYVKYWRTLVPQTDRECWLRWVFAFMSVHTTWSSNVAGYKAVAALPENFTPRELEYAVVSSGVGLHRMRQRGIWNFTLMFRANPIRFGPRRGASVRYRRDTLADELFGIGMAKTSFAFELMCPLDCDVVCLDTHILRLYGHSGGSPAYRLYRRMEQHWRGACQNHGVPVAMARHVYWDRLQGRPDNRYWASCLERRFDSAESNLRTAV